jgi:hypothetical protein
MIRVTSYKSLNKISISITSNAQVLGLVGSPYHLFGKPLEDSIDAA